MHSLADYPESVVKRFWAKVNITDSCWMWTGAPRNRVGHSAIYAGTINGKARHLFVHRLSWMLHRGPIPRGKMVLHHCDVPRCVNPGHLFLGDQFDNMRDCAAKGRVATIGQARKTHCTNGHQFTPENTIRTAEGWRTCRKCTAASNRRYKAAKRLRKEASL